MAPLFFLAEGGTPAKLNTNEKTKAVKPKLNGPIDKIQCFDWISHTTQRALELENEVGITFARPAL